jgi:hypothetical protein
VSGIPESWKSVAAELRARAEKARAEANRSSASDGLLYAGLMVEARTYDEAASLVEALRSPARVDPEDVERAERWIGDKIHRYYDKGYDEEDDRDVAALRSVMDFVRALEAASWVREDDEDGPCPGCEDGCERCDPRFLSTDRVADADIDAVSNLVAAHGNADHIAAMDRLIARAVPAPTTLNGEDDG